jgi:hypothetical protein
MSMAISRLRTLGATRVAIALVVIALTVGWLQAEAVSPVSQSMSCGSGFPYSGAGRASVSGYQRFASTENTYNACYYIYLNGNATGSPNYYVYTGGWVSGWAPFVSFDVSYDLTVYDIQGTHNICQTTSGTICNPSWVYTDAY